jgi:hypothetical protein
MRFKRALAVATASGACMLALQAVNGQGASAAAGPSVTSLSPGSGIDAGGTVVTITGSDFTGASTVTFGPYYADFTVDSDTEITATAPEGGDGPADVSVTTPDGTSPDTPSDQFTYVPAPAVTGASPGIGPVAGGTVVTLTGTGFTGATAVWLDNTELTGFTVDSDTQITVTMPPAPGGTPTGGYFTVVTPVGSSMPSPPDGSYEYEAPPVVQAFQPFTGPTAGGDQVSIFGSGFDGATAVMFGSTPATSFRVLDNQEIFASAPAHAAGGVPITVTTPGGSGTSLLSYYYVAPVTVGGIFPSSGPATGGNTVTINGTDFTNATAVDFGSVPAANFTVDSDGEITATAPAGTASPAPVEITVTTPDGTSATTSEDEYTYQTCTTTITGTSNKKLAVTSGLTCLVNATQNAPVSVGQNAQLLVTNSTITGNVTANEAAAITLCGTTVRSSLSVTDALGPVLLGSIPGTCAADTIPSGVTITGAIAPVSIIGLKQNGTLTLENDSAGITLDGSQVNGRAYVENNTSEGTAEVLVSGNTVTGSLYCTGNNPAPIDNGTINTVSGTASGQCAYIAQR